MTYPTDKKLNVTDEDALNFHNMHGKPGKLEVNPTKPMATQRDLALAYSPGVAAPVKAIAENESDSYAYTNRGNLVAVISNGTAILGLGALGALASKPVMEGKAVLFKRFAAVDAIDLEIDTANEQEFINAVKYMGPSFGGINLEDIAAPECFIIEQKLREIMDIPIFHDDQHGTAIISAAGLINAAHLTNRNMEDIKIVINGAGAAGIACLELAKSMGIKDENAILCDRAGVIYEGRAENMDQWKSKHAVNTTKRTLAEAMEGADVAFGLSAAGAFTSEMVKSMAPNPIIFAMANPVPEISPDEVKAIRDDVIMATGRSDFPNQVNNVLGFPYIFRGALDVHAKTINDEMKIAAANALAMLARSEVPDEVVAAYGYRPHFGPEYIIPVAFDPRLIAEISASVAQAAMDSGVARDKIEDMHAYKLELSGRLNPAIAALQNVFTHVKSNPKRIVFAEGEEEQVIRAAFSFKADGFGTPILVGRKDVIVETVAKLGLRLSDDIEIQDIASDHINEKYVDFLHDRIWRKGYLRRDIIRFIRLDRNVYSSCMVANGDADGMVTGVTRNWDIALKNVRLALDTADNQIDMGLALVVCQNRSVVIADTAVHYKPTGEEIADIAEQAARVARRIGLVPRVGIMARSNFGFPRGERADRMREALAILKQRNVDFEFDGEMRANIALNRYDRETFYPLSELTDNANVLVMADWNVATTAADMLQELGGCTVIGPLLTGLNKPVQIASLGATETDLVNLAALAAFDLNETSTT